MAISQARSRRKPTGSRYKNFRGKRHFETGSTPIHTKIGESKQKIVRRMGGSKKLALLRSNAMNMINSNKKAVKATIKNVLDNKANRNFVRANILTKGSIVDTDKGKARITNRPGQEGTINGVLVSDSEK